MNGQQNPTAQAVHRNRLADEKSPYLRQHADNPVDWHPWGDEALQRAVKDQKPIFLSIGYSACHWCHVMEHESFENDEIAAILNKSFVSIKVDREERPDIDEVYMTAVQLMERQGGWPLTVFLTPDLHPFAGGTYFQPEHFKAILLKIDDVWKNDRANLVGSANALADAVKSVMTEPAAPAKAAVDPKWFDRAVETHRSRFDSEQGGFNTAPKFPPSMDLMLLLREWRRTGDAELLAMAEKTLTMMGRGGIYDHIGGGFHRYSTDERWFVPHFEKMLYDQAMISRAYLEAHQATGNPFYARVARETLDYVLRDMVEAGDGFAASEDADSEGGEGAFYTWTSGEIDRILTKDEAAAFKEFYGVTASGNYEHGTNILSARSSEPISPTLASARQKVFAHRAGRRRPARDDKVLTSWNGLMISSLALGSRALDDDKYLRAAEFAARFLLARHVDKRGRLMRVSVGGVARIPGYLDDYAHLIVGLVDLYEAGGDPAWLRAAINLNDEAAKLFRTGKGGGYFHVGNDVAVTLANPMEVTDGVIPSGNAMMVIANLRLAALTGKDEWRGRAQETALTFAGTIERYPAAMAMMLCGLDLLRASPREIVVVGRRDDPRTREMLRAVWGGFLPNKVVVVYDGSTSAASIPLLEGRTTLTDTPVAYVCEQGTCRLPVTDAAALRAQLFPAEKK